MRTVQIARHVLVAAALSAAASTQSVIVHESLSNAWGHAHGSPYWTDDVPNAGAEFGVVDQLNFVWWLEFTSATFTLQPGQYMANARFMKTNGTSGRYPLELRTVVDGYPVSVTMPDAEQTVGSFVRTPNLCFTVTQPNTQVQFTLRNIDATLKQDYVFDSFQLGATGAQATSIHSLSDISPANAAFFTQDVAEANSAFGKVLDQDRAGLWWLEMDKDVVLQPGANRPRHYWVTVRLMKYGSTQGREDIKVRTTANGVSNEVVLLAANQPVDQYVHTPWVLVRADTPDTQVQIKVLNTDATIKYQYKFDAVHIVHGTEFYSSGTGCAGTNGQQPIITRPSGAWLNGEIVNKLERAPSNAPVAFMVGLAPNNIPLDAVGMTGCTLLVDPIFIVSGSTDSAGEFEWRTPILNLRAQLDWEFHAQAAIVDAGANSLGVIASRAGITIVGY